MTRRSCILLLCAALAFGARTVAQESLRVSPAVERWFAKHPIVDGNLLPGWRTMVPAPGEDPPVRRSTRFPADLREVVAATGVDVTTTGASPQLETQPALLEFYRSRPGGRVVLTRSDLDEALRDQVLGVLFQIQKPYVIGSVEAVDAEVGTWFDAGLRIVQLAYNREDNQRFATHGGPYAGGADEDDLGLTEKGRALVHALFDRGMLVDLSHVGERSTLEAAAIALDRGRPVMANHANAAAVNPHRRNKSDAEIQAIARSGGLIAVTPIQKHVDLENATTERFLDHIVYLTRTLDVTDGQGERIDMLDHVGVATDAWVNGWEEDSVFYVDARMASPARWKILATLLHERHGYRFEDLEKLFGGNFLRIYREALPR